MTDTAGKGCAQSARRGELDWLQPYDEVDYGFGNFIAGVGLIVCGKRTYKALLKQGWGWGFAQPGMV